MSVPCPWSLPLTTDATSCLVKLDVYALSDDYHSLRTNDVVTSTDTNDASDAQLTRVLSVTILVSVGVLSISDVMKQAFDEPIVVSALGNGVVAVRCLGVLLIHQDWSRGWLLLWGCWIDGMLGSVTCMMRVVRRIGCVRWWWCWVLWEAWWLWCDCKGLW